jgi:CheY-like chemotaxis protein
VSRPERKKIILVIDDSQTINLLLGKAAFERGHNCLSASSIEEGMKAMQGSKVDLVITDLIMPGVGGIAGIPMIRKANPDMPIIAMSAGSGDEAAQTMLKTARQAGADAVFKKPFKTDVMMDKVNLLLGGGAVDVETVKKKSRVLVIDDSSTIRQIISSFLPDETYTVTTAESMEEALDTWDIVGLDVVITDIFMSGMGGTAGIARIKANWPDVKIVAISGGFDAMGKDKALISAEKVGANATLQKPFEREQLLATIASIQ